MSPSTFVAVALTLAAGVSAVGNDALHANPDDVDLGLTTHGSDWLWAVFAIMLVSDLIFIGWHFRLPRGQRVFHQLPILILTTASIAYFSMASNLGNTGIRTEFHTRGTRAIWYVRYIDWIITTPLLLLELLLGTGLPLSDIVTVIFMDVAMIVVGLVGALVASSYKWGYFTMGMFCEFYIWWILIGPARTTAGLLGNDHRSAFTRSAFMLTFLWMLYPIAWGLADGSNTISVTKEMIFYGILDILAKPVFCFFHISSLRRIPYDSYGFTNFHHGIGNSHNGVLGEKRGLTAGNNNGAGGLGSSPMSAQNTAGTATTGATGHGGEPLVGGAHHGAQTAGGARV